MYYERGDIYLSMRVLRFRVLASCFSVFLGVLLCAVLGACSSLLYYPDRNLYVNKNKLSPQPDEFFVDVNPQQSSWPLEFKSGKSFKIGVWHFKQNQFPKPKGRILQFHGNGQNMSAHFVSLYWLVAYGYDLIVFDYPGYGPVPGDPTPQNTVQAGLAIIEFLIHQDNTSDLILVGQSLGGAVMLSTLAHTSLSAKVQAVVIDGSFLSYKSVAREVLSKHWWSWWMQPFSYILLSDKWAPISFAERLPPKAYLVTYGSEDLVVNPENSKKLFQALPDSDKELTEFSGEGHITQYTSVRAKENQKIFLKWLTKSRPK